MTKAQALFQLTEHLGGPDFPLDDDTLDLLEGYPGELPTSPEHYVDLLMG